MRRVVFGQEIRGEDPRNDAAAEDTVEEEQGPDPGKYQGLSSAFNLSFLIEQSGNEQGQQTDRQINEAGDAAADAPKDEWRQRI